MDKEQKVVVVLPLQYYANNKQDKFAARIRDLGLTAYGTTREEAKKKAKQMFAAYVAAHRKEGTLEKRLKTSGLKWWWVEDYEGDVECVSPDGSTHILHCKPKIENLN
jgi:predicted RNase H-like HicB family nuclease